MIAAKKLKIKDASMALLGPFHLSILIAKIQLYLNLINNHPQALLAMESVIMIMGSCYLSVGKISCFQAGMSERNITHEVDIFEHQD